MNKELEFIKKERIIPVIKIQKTEDAVPLLDALQKGGINIAEITFRSECAEDALAAAVEGCPDMLVGAGTILNAEQARRAIAKRAAFIVSPGFCPQVAAVCGSAEVLYIPGCVSATEIMAALACGINVVKFFPAENCGGVNAIKALSAAFPSVSFIPTGGITKDNIRSYLSYEKVAACGAGYLTKDAAGADGLAAVTRLARQTKEAIQ